MDTITIKRNIDEFIKLAIKQEEYVYDGDSKKVNRLHKKIMSLQESVIAAGHLNQFVRTMNHANESVQLWSATILLKNDCNLGKQKLEQMIEYSSIYGLKAKTTIDIWHKGMLK